MITIVDYGMGNLGSIRNMLRRIGVDAIISGDPLAIADAEKLILPGVGAFDKAMARLSDCGLRGVLDRKALTDKVPILGICLGMQLLTRSSEEGVLPGLGWIEAATVRFPRGNGIKVPHMGWNAVTAVTESPLVADAPDGSRFYFVHSYYVLADDRRHAILNASHGVTFDAGIQADNIMGVQFHPEKSHRFGKHLLGNFASL